MYKYVKSARSLDELTNIIKQRLSVDGVDNVEVYSINSKYASVRLFYQDGTVSKTVTVRFDNKPDRAEASTTWDASWSVRDDGAVLDASGNLIGWFKLLKKKPQTATPNYLEDTLVADFGTQSIDLTDDSGETIADAVKPAK